DPASINAFIDQANNEIKKFDGYKNVIWFDLAQYYKNINGGIKAELFDYTKVHLSSLGYKVWREKLLELLTESE
ncbi:MAG: hypothetical protein LBB82_00275, partial [Treponema sp.]|nr:hypothetical protein [Treponema sp.]